MPRKVTCWMPFSARSTSWKHLSCGTGMRKKSRLPLYVSYVLMSKCTYLCQNTIRRTINSFTCPLVNPSTFVSFSVTNLTLWVPFLFTNRSPCRKKSILAKVCFDAKKGQCVNATKWIFISKGRHLHPFWGCLLLNIVQYGTKRMAFWC